MKEEKLDQFNFKDLWTIPNLITYFRILCIPVFIVLSVYAGLRNSMVFVYSALGVFTIAAASDIFDGMLARKFNWGTGIGMLLDPLADKLMHISIMICLAFAIKIDGVYFLHWAFVIAIVFKEALMILIAPIVAKRGIEVKANMSGKIASATISGGIIFCFFHPYVNPWDWAFITVGVAQSYYSAWGYFTDVVKQLRAQSKEAKASPETKDVD